MQYVTDLHLHSRFSRAVSKNMTLPVMAQCAKQKGIDVLSASDFTHPLWLKEMKNQLSEKEEGFYSLKQHEAYNAISFILSTEISCIYKQGGKLRRIHNLVLMPSFNAVEKLTKKLLQKCANLSADGRPIIGLSSKALLEMVLESDEQSLLIPCHIWTPHFGVYGSASGFDSLQECFEDLTRYVYGIETGLSSDPEMNWRVKELENRSILSFSDAHSPPKMLREATVMELSAPTFTNLRNAIIRPVSGYKSSVATNQHTKDQRPKTEDRIVYTIEFYPEEGKYHYSGHRNCHVSLNPQEIRSEGNICPVCHKKLTEGVLFRVQQLAILSTKDVLEQKKNYYGLTWITDRTRHHPPYVKLVPLLEIVAEAQSMSVTSQKVKNLYTKLCSELRSELHILLKESIEAIEKVGGKKVAEGVKKVRGGEIVIVPGYDGEYGKVQIWRNEQVEDNKKEISQLGLEI